VHDAAWCVTWSDLIPAQGELSMAQLALSQLTTTMSAALAVPPRVSEAGTAALGQQVSSCMSCGRRAIPEAILSDIRLVLTNLIRRQTGHHAQCGVAAPELVRLLLVTGWVRAPHCSSCFVAAWHCRTASQSSGGIITGEGQSRSRQHRCHRQWRRRRPRQRARRRRRWHPGAGPPWGHP
jgi:hypothetical protein